MSLKLNLYTTEERFAPCSECFVCYSDREAKAVTLLGVGQHWDVKAVTLSDA